MKTIAKWAGWGFLGVILLAGIGWLGLVIASDQMRNHRYAFTAKPLAAGPADIAVGGRLARIFGCTGCHGPDLRGQVLVDDPMLGRYTAPNLTLLAKGYSDAQLAQVIRGGVRPDGSALFIMPAEAFSRLTDEEAAEIIGYLRSLPAGGKALGQTVEPGPLGRFGVLAGQFKMAPEQVAQYQRRPLPDYGPQTAAGRGVARACAECHGPDLSGVKDLGPDLRIAAAYDLPAFARLLRTGTALDGKPVKAIGAIGETKGGIGLMGEIAPLRFGALTDAEIANLHAYLTARVSHLPN